MMKSFPSGRYIRDRKRFDSGIINEIQPKTRDWTRNQSTDSFPRRFSFPVKPKIDIQSFEPDISNRTTLLCNPES